MISIESVEVINRKHITDGRGIFLKVMNGSEAGIREEFGEIYVVQGYPGEYRAVHYHKVATEWFTIISGSSILRLKDITTGVILEFNLVADVPVTIKVPPMVAHSFFNHANQNFTLLAYADRRYFPDDTIPVEIF